MLDTIFTKDARANIVSKIHEKIEHAMTNMEAKIVAEIGREVEHMISRELYIDTVTSSHYRDGILTAVIRERIGEYALSDEFKKQVDEAIIAAIPAQAERVIAALVNSRLRKELFSATVPENFSSDKK